MQKENEGREDWSWSRPEGDTDEDEKRNQVQIKNITRIDVVCEEKVLRDLDDEDDNEEEEEEAGRGRRRENKEVCVFRSVRISVWWSGP